jgi:hypothetical protein
LPINRRFHRLHDYCMGTGALSRYNADPIRIDGF